jgi:hypothetical protein
MVALATLDMMALVRAPNDLVPVRPKPRLRLYWAGPTHDETVTSVPTGS